MSTKAPAAELYELYDCHPEIAVVRAKDDDETFWRLVANHVRELGFWDLDYHDSDDKAVAVAKDNIEPPAWRWYRKNVNSPEVRDAFGWAWSLGFPDGPGPGNWRGATVRLRPLIKAAGGGQ